MSKTDEELMIAYSQNEHLESFDELYSRYNSKTYGFILKRFNNPARAQEVFQNVFLKLHHSRHLYDSKFPFAPWFFTLARNVINDSLRETLAHSPEKVSADGEIETISDIHQNLSSETENETHEWLQKTLNENLDSRDRELVEMRYGRDWTFSQIAENLGLAESAVRKRISRAIKKLRGAV